MLPDANLGRILSYLREFWLQIASLVVAVLVLLQRVLSARSRLKVVATAGCRFLEKEAEVHVRVRNLGKPTSIETIGFRVWAESGGWKDWNNLWLSSVEEIGGTNAIPLPIHIDADTTRYFILRFLLVSPRGDRFRELTLGRWTLLHTDKCVLDVESTRRTLKVKMPFRHDDSVGPITRRYTLRFCQTCQIETQQFASDENFQFRLVPPGSYISREDEFQLRHTLIWKWVCGRCGKTNIGLAPPIEEKMDRD